MIREARARSEIGFTSGACRIAGKEGGAGVLSPYLYARQGNVDVGTVALR